MSNRKSMYDLLDTVMEGASTVGTYALGALGLACEGAEKLADAVKLRYRAAQVESELEDELMKAGEMAYAAYTGNSQTSNVMEENMRNIDILKVELGALNDQLGRTEESLVCPVCGAAVEEADHFCRSCGEKLN